MPLGVGVGVAINLVDGLPEMSVPANARYLEDGTVRYLEDGVTVRILGG